MISENPRFHILVYISDSVLACIWHCIRPLRLGRSGYNEGAGNTQGLVLNPDYRKVMNTYSLYLPSWIFEAVLSHDVPPVPHCHQRFVANVCCWHFLCHHSFIPPGDAFFGLQGLPGLAYGYPLCRNRHLFHGQSVDCPLWRRAGAVEPCSMLTSILIQIKAWIYLFIYQYIYPGWAGYKNCILPQRPAENNVQDKKANIFNKKKKRRQFLKSLL